jgi:hypothetical protein
MAYDFKEQFCRIYELKEKRKAAHALDKWREDVQKKQMAKPFQQLLSITKNWRTEILAYFDFDGELTNGYIEGFNSVLKAENRKGMGYTFDVLRARVLYGQRLKRKHIKLAQHIELTRKKLDQERPEVAVTEVDVKKREIAANVSDEMDEWNNSLQILADEEYKGTCDMCGTVGDILLLEHHFDFLPGVSYTGGPLENVFTCSSCYEGFNQEQKEYVAAIWKEKLDKLSPEEALRISRECECLELLAIRMSCKFAGPNLGPYLLATPWRTLLFARPVTNLSSKSRRIIMPPLQPMNPK